MIMFFRVTVWSDTLRLPQSRRLSTISIPSRYFYLSSLDHFIWINKAISFLSNIFHADPRPTARGGVHAKKRLRRVHMWNQQILQVWIWIWLNYSSDNLFFRLNNNGFAQVIPFKVPRKSELFQVLWLQSKMKIESTQKLKDMRHIKTLFLQHLFWKDKWQV